MTFMRQLMLLMKIPSKSDDLQEREPMLLMKIPSNRSDLHETAHAANEDSF